MSCVFPECQRLRNIFISPAMALMLATLVVPLVIVGVYSVLTRGAYGGVEMPFTLENYARLVRSAVRIDFRALLLDRGGGYRAMSSARVSSGAFHRTLGSAKKSLS